MATITEEQKAALNNPPLVCKAEIFNNTPPEWHARIIAAGARFDYTDGTSLQKGPVEITIDPGQSVYFLSDDKCVQHVLVTAAVAVPNQPVQTIAGDDDASAGKCLIYAPFSLIPKQNSIDDSDREKGNRSAISKEVVLK